jgi:hypothetical protein
MAGLKANQFAESAFSSAFRASRPAGAEGRAANPASAQFAALFAFALRREIAKKQRSLYRVNTVGAVVAAHAAKRAMATSKTYPTYSPFMTAHKESCAHPIHAADVDHPHLRTIERKNLVGSRHPL